jgi:capsular polysaccharide biosynthesis protein
MSAVVDAVEIAAWDPGIILSDLVALTPKIEQFMARARAGYSAPPIRFDDPQEMLVSGRHFAVVTRQGGLLDASVHTLPRFRWRQAFEPVARIGFAPEAPALIAASAGYGNYFHWTMETAAAALMHRRLHQGEPIALVVPPLQDTWKRDVLQTLGIESPLIVLPSHEALVVDMGVLTSLTGPTHSFAPHPAMLELLRSEMDRTKQEHSSSRRIYVSRIDAGDRRRMVNEEELCAALLDFGFEIVTAGLLSVTAQAALFRNAELVVAPHGAALTNLVYAEDGERGPAVVELFQENYVNRCFLKLCQGKRLSYRAVINPGVSNGSHHHQSTWRADIPLIRHVLAGMDAVKATGAPW